ncbi:unnamed protein product [Hermetia illucens]|uniref:Uncharacterized protein n=1 Tax=Hermetia illucens TaxID=343691 RepID=A0A7R8UX01_HERIL|nr:unnamed protein product [Hermetia illucens]
MLGAFNSQVLEQYKLCQSGTGTRAGDRASAVRIKKFAHQYQSSTHPLPVISPTCFVLFNSKVNFISDSRENSDIPQTRQNGRVELNIQFIHPRRM